MRQGSVTQRWSVDSTVQGRGALVSMSGAASRRLRTGHWGEDDFLLFTTVQLVLLGTVVDTSRCSAILV